MKPTNPKKKPKDNGKDQKPPPKGPLPKEKAPKKPTKPEKKPKDEGPLPKDKGPKKRKEKPKDKGEGKKPLPKGPNSKGAKSPIKPKGKPEVGSIWSVEKVFIDTYFWNHICTDVMESQAQSQLQNSVIVH